MQEVYQTKQGANVICEVFVNQTDGTIHVLDSNQEETTSVTNGIDEIQALILDKHLVSGAIGDWIWVLYGTDGIATLFENGSFQMAPDSLLYKPFVEAANNYAF
ncbi:hypothetical protein JK635_07730 [Neobacillus sp. YIM B02564]|uniref:Uncharacterized protein n=1 Tax=Neobacillus paridis TaxID=2803862 RepID=A0ABS1TM77_9BACI|nr:hypothetical protein [Neobacillus paridis]MBL4952099.1 hypothetical protein [Neobacillus paridis]